MGLRKTFLKIDGFGQTPRTNADEAPEGLPIDLGDVDASQLGNYFIQMTRGMSRLENTAK